MTFLQEYGVIIVLRPIWYDFHNLRSVCVRETEEAMGVCICDECTCVKKSGYVACMVCEQVVSKTVVASVSDVRNM